MQMIDLIILWTVNGKFGQWIIDSWAGHVLRPFFYQALPY